MLIDELIFELKQHGLHEMSDHLKVWQKRASLDDLQKFAEAIIAGVQVAHRRRFHATENKD